MSHLNKEALGINDNEIVIHNIRPHPFGAMAIWSIALLILGLILVFVRLIVSNSGSLGILENNLIIWLVATSLGVLILTGALITHYVYYRNSLIITDENVIEVTQKSIFDKSVSRLNLGKVQDVNVSQKGVFATLMNYGTVAIETAGEAANYNFKFCPKAGAAAKNIMDAHNAYASLHGIDNSV